MASHVMTQAERMCLHSAATDLHAEFRGIFGTETIESLLLDSYAELASRATVTTWLVIGAERFARQRLQALAHVRPPPAPSPDSAIPVRAQRRALADGARLVHPPRRGPCRRLVRRIRARHPARPGRRRRHGRSRHRHHRRVLQALHSTSTESQVRRQSMIALGHAHRVRAATHLGLGEHLTSAAGRAEGRAAH
jgi:hypothetical protein